jgi:hypothetical protein
VKYGRSADNFVRPVAQFSLLLTPTFVSSETRKFTFLCISAFYYDCEMKNALHDIKVSDKLLSIV